MEIINDLNMRVINWWRAVRDEPDEFGRLVELTPFSRAEYEWALSAMDDESLPPIRRALAFHVVVAQCVNHGDSGTKGTWSRRFSPNVGSVFLHSALDIKTLSGRLRYVQLDCVDATVLLDRVRDMEYAVIYADPPYPSSDTSGYAVRSLDVQRCADLLAVQRGAVAVSGYGDEWDILGWRREERPAVRRQIRGRGEPRTEVLWLNPKASETARPRLI